MADHSVNKFGGYATAKLLLEARDLLSEHGENPEYDRALVELVSRVLGFSEDERPAVELMLGLATPAHMGTPHYGAVTTIITCTCGWKSNPDNERRVDSSIQFNQHLADVERINA